LSTDKLRRRCSTPTYSFAHVTQASPGPAGSTHRTVRIVLALSVVALFQVAAAPAADAKRRVPRGFVGVMVDGPLTNGGFSHRGQLDAMVRNGVESVRAAFYWSHAQRYGRWEDTPAADRSAYRNIDGIPTDFREMDALVLSAARRRLRVLPAVLHTPRWAQPPRFQGKRGAPPADPSDYARFVRALVLRYGPGGSFWREHPGTEPFPIRTWQVWNEPQRIFDWRERPWQPGYSRLLDRANKAIKRADPGARVVIAGFFGESWKHLASLYRLGARADFDVAAIHPYTGRPSGTLEILRRVRRTMRKYGDSRTPLFVTEWSWPTSRGRLVEYHSTWETTERGQGPRIRDTFRYLVRNRHELRLRRMYYYTWLTSDTPGASPFGFAGLRRLEDSGRIVSKPGLGYFRRMALHLEGCASKRVVASRCYRPAP